MSVSENDFFLALTTPELEPENPVVKGFIMEVWPQFKDSPLAKSIEEKCSRASAEELLDIGYNAMKAMGSFFQKLAEGSDNLFDYIDCVIGFINLRFSLENFNKRLERVFSYNFFSFLASWWHLETRHSSILEEALGEDHKHLNVALFGICDEEICEEKKQKGGCRHEGSFGEIISVLTEQIWKQGKDEIREIFSLTLAEKCAKRFSNSSALETLLSPFQPARLVAQVTSNHDDIDSVKELQFRLEDPNEDLRNLYNAIRRDCINKTESHLAKENGITRDEWREYREKEKLMEQLEMKGENPSVELRRRYEELNQKRIHRIKANVVTTELQDFEDTLTEMELSNEVVDYFVNNPEETARAIQRRKKICNALQEWVDRQPKQAHLANEVVEYIIRTVTEPTFDSEEAFKVTKIAEALNSRRKTKRKTTRKEVRSVLDKIKEEVSFLECLLD